MVEALLVMFVMGVVLIQTIVICRCLGMIAKAVLYINKEESRGIFFVLLVYIYGLAYICATIQV